MSTLTGSAAARGLPFITRRAALGALAVLPAVTLPERLGAAAEPAGALAQLIADWRRKCAEYHRLADELDALVGDTVLPPDFIRFGRKRIVREDAGEVTFGRWEASCQEDIRRHFRHAKCGIFGPVLVAKAERRERRLLAALDRQLRRHEAARTAAGIPALEDLVDAADAARWDQLDAIFAYRPATIGEHEAKIAFLGELLAGGLDFDGRDLALIFGVSGMQGEGV